MSVTDLHPEDLLDREEGGVLTESERAMLDAHLAQCSACRFERHARRDFESELAAATGRPIHDGALRVSTAIKVAAETRSEPEVTSSPTPHAAPTEIARAPAARRAPKRAAALILIAASFLLATASFAAVRNGTFVQMLRAAGLATDEPEAGTGERHAEAVRASEGRKTSPAPVPTVPERSKATDESAPVEADVPAPAVVEVAPVAPAPVPSAKPAAPLAAAAPTIAPVPAPATAPAASHAPVDSASLFGDASAARRRGDRALATRAYRELLDRFPSSPEASSARVAFGRLLLDGGDPAEGLVHFRAYLVGGDTALREEAMVGQARCLERLGRAGEERRAWTLLVDAYPQSVHVERARTRLGELGPN